MALLQNSFLQNQLPTGWRGGMQGNAVQARGKGDRMNQSSAFGAFAATPTASYPPTAWILPLTAGAIACSTGIQSSAALTADLQGGLPGSVSLSGSGDITLAQALAIMVGEANLSGSGTLTADIQGLVALLANITGSGDLTANIQGVLTALANLSGSGDLSASIGGALTASANLSGSGDLSADIFATIQAAASLSGMGDITTAEALMVWVMAADLSGSGDLEADIEATATMLANLSGEGDLEAGIEALATIAANITSSGELLTSAAIAAAVRALLHPDLDTINEGVQKASLLIPHSEDLNP